MYCILPDLMRRGQEGGWSLLDTRRHERREIRDTRWSRQFAGRRVACAVSSWMIADAPSHSTPPSRRASQCFSPAGLQARQLPAHACGPRLPSAVQSTGQHVDCRQGSGETGQWKIQPAWPRGAQWFISLVPRSRRCRRDFRFADCRRQTRAGRTLCVLPLSAGTWPYSTRLFLSSVSFPPGPPKFPFLSLPQSKKLEAIGLTLASRVRAAIDRVHHGRAWSIRTTRFPITQRERGFACWMWCADWSGVLC